MGVGVVSGSVPAGGSSVGAGLAGAGSVETSGGLISWGGGSGTSSGTMADELAGFDAHAAHAIVSTTAAGVVANQ